MATGLTISGNVVHDKMGGFWVYYEDIGSRYITLTNNVSFNPAPSAQYGAFGGCAAYGDIAISDNYVVGGAQFDSGPCVTQHPETITSTDPHELTTSDPAAECAGIPACNAIVENDGLQPEYVGLLAQGPSSHVVRADSTQLTYTGAWTTWDSNKERSSTDSAASVALTFPGSGLDYICTAASNRGTFTTTITDLDANGQVLGTQTRTGSCYTPQVVFGQVGLSVRGLSTSPGVTHKIVVTNPDGGTTLDLHLLHVYTPNAQDLADGKPATQSSDFVSSSGKASKAVDGNVDGAYDANSVTHTGLDANAWWNVDLGVVQRISTIDVHNRTDCCADRLSDYWVFVSSQPFNTALTPTQQQAVPGVWSSHRTTQAGNPTQIPVNITGRYVMIQLGGSNYLSLAEVDIW